ncbi:glycosyltransferase family 2 protein [Paenibacillus pasadenensis]|uniref:glycosyltransferase family 2 protein n=1 Tax=Paenibacillus pasadenensis TaxID=217090 RepID=UPI000407F5D0|nr:glycosyltransferase [Paenibacillus pasadenensis]
MGMRASIILPCRDKHPLVLLTLFALERQTVPPDCYEVILVDDASSDATPGIPAAWSFPYRLRLLRSEAGLGRPAARNAGIRIAEGEVLIFLDAEVLVGPGFVESHLRLHEQDGQLLASGVLTMKGAYTHLHPGFSAEQVQQAYSLIFPRPRHHAAWEAFMGGGGPQLLLGREDIHAEAYVELSFAKPMEAVFEAEILQRFGDRLTGFHLPWLISHTGNLSVRRAAFERCGLFEEYEGYGWDDLELGYRLFRQGYRFAHIREPAVYHQEHPVAPSVGREAQENFFRFQQKYRDISLLVLLLLYLPAPMSFYQAHLVLDEVYRLDAESAGIYLPLLGTMRSMLEAAGYLLRHGQQPAHLAAHAGCPPGSAERAHFEAQRAAIAASGRWPTLVEALARLTSL